MAFGLQHTEHPPGLDTVALSARYRELLAIFWEIRKRQTSRAAFRELALQIQITIDAYTKEMSVSDHPEYHSVLNLVDPDLFEVLSSIQELYGGSMAGRAFIWTAFRSFDMGESNGPLVEIK